MAGIKVLTPGDIRLALKLCSQDLPVVIKAKEIRILSRRLARIFNSWTHREIKQGNTSGF